MRGFFVRLLISAAGLWLASAVVPGIRFQSGWSLIGAAFLLGIVNAIVRPVLVFLTLPITILSLGIFLLVINAAMLGLVALVLEGFSIDGFIAALLGSILVGFTSWIASWFIGPRGKYDVLIVRRRQR